MIFHNKEPALFAFSCFMVANLHRVCAFTEFFAMLLAGHN